MKILQDILELAFQGGYPYRDDPDGNPYTEEDHYRIVCSQEFWVSLGKALGWEKSTVTFKVKKKEISAVSRKGTIYYTRDAHTITRPVRNAKMKWKRIAREFFDLLLTGGDTEKFWADLISDKK